MLGAGLSRPQRRFALKTSAPETETTWRTLDINPWAKPDQVFDLEELERGSDLPFGEPFDEIHAYEVLEHFGRQGDYRGLFRTFGALWRGLKFGGYLVGSCPSLQSPWLWGEPGHTRVITHGTLVFLTRKHYDQLGETACSDYRNLIEPFWWEVDESYVQEDTFVFAVRKTP